MKKLLFVLLLSQSAFAYSQIVRENVLIQKMEQGTELMATGQYDSAEVVFKFILENMEKLPSDMAYLFGRNSYHQRKYKQSINWLNKYIQLKGTKGKFYEAAIQYLQYAEDEFLKIQRSLAAQTITELSNATYDCGGLEKMLCPVCHGSGVVIKKGLFDELYHTCPYSLGEGYLTCEEYNLFMRGLLDPKIKN